MTPFMVVLQREILGATDPAGEVIESGHQLAEVSASTDWRRRLNDIEQELANGAPWRPLLFVSLDLARYVRRHCPQLRRGLLLDAEKLRVHRWSGYLSGHHLLNRSFVLLPFGALLSRQTQLENLFGPRLFLRPDSSMKEFPGLCIDIENLADEVSSLMQIYRPDPDLLCVVDVAQDLPLHEHRFWLADGEILSSAPYAFGPGGVHPDVEAPPCPAALCQAALEVAKELEFWENPVVADLTLDGEGSPRLVEINAFSTSGFYPGISMSKILSALDPILIG